MSYSKAREIQAREPDSRPEQSVLCTWKSGCGNRWTCNFGQALCSAHDAMRHTAGATAPPPKRLLASMPTLGEVVRPFCDPERDE